LTTATKKQRTRLPASQAVGEHKEPSACQSDEEESGTGHHLTSSDDDHEAFGEIEEPEEPVPQPEGEDYDTDEDLHYASDAEDELPEKEQSFHYEFAMVWRIEDSKKKCLQQNVKEIRSRMRLFLPLDLFQQWYQDEMATNLRDYRFKSLAFKASYDNGDRSDASHFSGDQDGYHNNVNQLVRWFLLGYRDVTLSLTAHVKKMSPTAAALARSTIRRSLARVPDLRTRLGTGGHPAAQIRRQWTCKWQDCERYGLTCWWGVKDLPKYHVPIRSTHIRSWSYGIFEGNLTPKAPGAALIQRMMRHDEARKIMVAPTPARELTLAFHGMPSTHQHSVETNGFTLYLNFYGPEYTLGHVWGGFKLLDSPFSALEQLEQLKTSCLSNGSWHGEHSAFKTTFSTLVDHGYNVGAIAYMDAEDWEDCGLPERYRVRMNKAA